MNFFSICAIAGPNRKSKRFFKQQNQHFNIMSQLYITQAKSRIQHLPIIIIDSIYVHSLFSFAGKQIISYANSEKIDYNLNLYYFGMSWQISFAGILLFCQNEWFMFGKES